MGERSDLVVQGGRLSNKRPLILYRFRKEFLTFPPPLPRGDRGGFFARQQTSPSPSL